MKTEYFLFVHHTKSILAKLRTWCFEHSGEISYSLLVNPSHTDESWEEQHTCVCVCVCVCLYIDMSSKTLDTYFLNFQKETKTNIS